MLAMTPTPRGWCHRTGASIALLLTSALLALGMVAPAHAVNGCTIYWTGGAGDHDWFNRSNWSTSVRSDGTDSTATPGDGSRICVASDPVSRGVVLDTTDVPSMSVTSIQFPGADDSLTITGRVSGRPQLTLEQPIPRDGAPRLSTIHTLHLDGGYLESTQGLRVPGPTTMDNGGTLQGMGPGASLLGPVEVKYGQIFGDVTLYGDTTFYSLYAHHLTNRGTMTAGPVDGAFVGDHDTSLPPEDFLNLGTVRGSASGTSYLIAGLRNLGRVAAPTGGVLRIVWSPALSSSGVLTGGTYDANDGVIDLDNKVLVNKATIRTRGTGHLMFNSYDDALNRITENDGTLDLVGSLTTAADVVNTGNVTLHSATLDVGSYRQTSGSTRLVARARIDGNVDIDAGSLWGNGFVTGNVTLGPESTTKVQVRPTNADRLSVSGSANLDGTLAFETTGPSEPDPGTGYRFLVSATRTGTFSAVTGDRLTQRRYDVQYESTGARVATEPLATP
jgi:hypothetical protein